MQAKKAEINSQISSGGVVAQNGVFRCFRGVAKKGPKRGEIGHTMHVNDQTYDPMPHVPPRVISRSSSRAINRWVDNVKHKV